MNFRIGILPLSIDNGLFGGKVSGQRSGKLRILRMGNYP